MIISPADKIRLFDLPKINDARGNLTFIEGANHVPFFIKRVYYLYDIPSGSFRGGHSHKKLEQLIVAINGSFKIKVDDAFHVKEFVLSKPYEGLYIPPMVWRDLVEFSSDSVCMVLASEEYDEKDYYRVYDEFIKDARKENNGSPFSRA